jgi:predicted 2-oxoglutarate/Fe(II)-dependent dioxygenase YbiX
VHSLKDYILIVDKIISTELCDTIIKEYHNSDEWEVSRIQYGVVNLDIRNVSSIELSSASVIADKPNRALIDAELFKSVSIALKTYNEKYNHVHISKDTGYTLLRYNTGQFYKEHVDHSLTNVRTLSCAIILNDDYEGGEFSFFNNQLKYSLKKGSAILFPSNFMYPHQILPVTKGVRYSIITWLV